MVNYKFFALGGLGEVGKNMYVFETDKDLYLIDIGSEKPSSDVNGFDALVPDFTYITEHIDKLRGVFISRFGEKTTGAFHKIIRDLKVPFYASKFTIEAINRRYINNKENKDREDFNADDYKNIDFKVMEPNEVFEFEDSKIEAFKITTSVPDSFGFAIKIDVSEEGEEPNYKNCVYLPDCDLDQNVWGHFKTELNALAKIADEGVVCLFSASTGAPKMGHVTTDGNLDLALRKLMAQDGRMFLLMDAENTSGILQVIDAAYVQKRHVTIVGHKARDLVELAMELKYTRINQNLYMKKEVLTDEKRNAKDSVIILAGERDDPFNFMSSIARFEDKHFRIKNGDNVVLLLDVPKKYEKKLARIWNEVLFNNVKLVDFDVNLIPVPMLGAEDLKIMYNLFSPKYIIPITGDFRMLKAQERIALDYGYKRENIISIENGDVATFRNTDFVNKDEKIETKEILFGMEVDSDINDFVAREREALTNEGFVVISGMINLKERTFHGDVEIESSGFLSRYGQEEEFESIKKAFKDIVMAHLRQRKVDYKELRQELKNELSKKILKDTKKRPILIPVVVDISGSNTFLEK